MKVNNMNAMERYEQWCNNPYFDEATRAELRALADLLSGYAHYAPGTFLIKLSMAVVAALIFRFLRNRPASKLLLAQAASGIVAEAIMVAGFFSYSCLWLGKGLAAAASIPGNLVQGALGLITATAIYVLLHRSSALAHIGSSSRSRPQ